MLARMHLAGQDFSMHQPNLRGLDWWNATVPVVLPYLTPAQAALLQSELAYQNHVSTLATYTALPSGPIHADLFRDNVMFASGDANVDGAQNDGAQTENSPAPQLTGFFDFYFAGVDAWVFDIAVCLNDWCVDLATGKTDANRSAAFLNAYAQVRPLHAAERELLPAMARAGALRFWLSRLWDFYLPREASMLKAHDPTHFERILRQRIGAPLTVTSISE